MKYPISTRMKIAKKEIANCSAQLDLLDPSRGEEEGELVQKQKAALNELYTASLYQLLSCLRSPESNKHKKNAALIYKHIHSDPALGYAVLQHPLDGGHKAILHEIRAAEEALKPWNAKKGWSLPLLPLDDAAFQSGYISIVFENDQMEIDSSDHPSEQPKKKKKGAYSFYTKLPDGQAPAGKFFRLYTIDKLIDVLIYRGLLQAKGWCLKASVVYAFHAYDDETDWRGSVTHVDFDADKCASAAPEKQPFTVLLNLDGDTPMHFLTVNQNVSHASPLGKKKEHVFSSGDIGVFSWRQWHAEGMTRTLPNVSVRFMVGSQDVFNPSPLDDRTIHPNHDNVEFSNAIDSKGPSW
jgi:hypothetical protein